MRVPVRLEDTTLGDTLGGLLRAQASGVLELCEPGGAVHRITIRDGRLISVESPQGPRLSHLLSRRYGVPEQVVERSVREAKGKSAPYGEILVERFCVPRARVRDALCDQMRERLEQLDQVSSARLSFRTGPSAHTRRCIMAELPIGEFLPGRRRARERNRQMARAESLGTTARQPDKASFRREVLRLHPDRFPHATPEEKAALTARLRSFLARARDGREPRQCER